MIQLIPAGLSTLGFAGLHLLLRHGPPFRKLKTVFAENQASLPVAPEAGLDTVTQSIGRRQRADPETLAAQAEARIFNEVHNVLQIPLAIAVLRQAAVNNNKAYGNTKASRIMANISAGYFWIDLAIVSKNFHQHGPEPLIHAFICVSFFTYIASRNVLHYYGARVLLFELSTPFVHFRWLLHSLHKDRTKAYKINGLLMMAAFACCRIGFGTRVIMDFWEASRSMIDGTAGSRGTYKIRPRTCRVIRGFAVGIQLLNTFWMSKMLQGAVKVFRRPS